jgi:hypothetical protein
MKTLLLISILAFNTLGAELPAKFVRAIHQVETGGRTGAIVGDNGAALGPLQIHKGCWLDSGMAGSYTNCADFNYSAKVMTAYLNRYAKAAIKSNDFETLARVWNGGPKGATKNATLPYWQRVRKQLGN